MTNKQEILEVYQSGFQNGKLCGEIDKENGDDPFYMDRDWENGISTTLDEKYPLVFIQGCKDGLKSVFPELED